MGERSGAPRASALHQLSFRNLRLRFNYRSQMSQLTVTHPRGSGELHRQLSATLAALARNRAARNRQQAAGARHDMRAWQVERRKRTRHLIELGGLVVKARVVDLTGDDRAIILGALLWMADKLKSNQGEQARALWAAKGMQALAVERATDAPTISQEAPEDGA